MPLIKLNDIEEKEIYPGYKARIIHTEHMTLAYWTIQEGSSFPEHFHEHEQVLSIIEGELELKLGDETIILKSGEVGIIPPYIAHSGKAINKTNAIDVFYPIRRDYV
ncbi:MAG: Cupin domain protein [Candidatus Methanofastidiosum methylothiophilum]|uniref:Cupin domain protein n=1 Tax=Candidatus Methanofastidiosum methylothiophilum TaxID=1705564 RepID=A0A150IZT1_9EURY|nr:MAG: Cupin domain protein [Candidatus Methanofastidiosum methylthiophilus]KYC47485.1 MAG: Cupin domain protein [Candidatus Methanofastidiosum methylthiophilus]KYC50385.1 MAG: Cupin domain protein [Candidatus Methanofastidiosum methylthiophilus]